MMTQQSVELLLSFLSAQYDMPLSEVKKLVHEYTKLETTDEAIRQENFERFNTWLSNNCQNVCKMKTQMTIDNFFELKRRFSSKQIQEMLLRMDNYKELTKKNLSVYLTFINWSARGYN